MKQFLFVASAIATSLLKEINMERQAHGLTTVVPFAPLGKLLTKILNATDHAGKWHGTLPEMFGTDACQAFPGNPECPALPADVFFPRSGVEMFSVAASPDGAGMVDFMHQNYHDIILNHAGSPRPFKSGAEFVDKDQHFVILSPY